MEIINLSPKRTEALEGAILTLYNLAEHIENLDSYVVGDLGDRVADTAKLIQELLGMKECS